MPSRPALTKFFITSAGGEQEAWDGEDTWDTRAWVASMDQYRHPPCFAPHRSTTRHRNSCSRILISIRADAQRVDALTGYKADVLTRQLTCN